MDPADPRVVRFLARSMVVRVVTQSRSGDPNIVPVWFVQRAGRIYMAVRAASPLARNIANNPEVVMLFDAEKAETRRRVLKLRGRARLLADRRTILRIGALSTLKFYLSPGGIMNSLRNVDRLGATFGYYRERAGAGAVIEITAAKAEFLPQM